MFLVSLESFQGDLEMFRPLVPNTIRIFSFSTTKIYKDNNENDYF